MHQAEPCIKKRPVIKSASGVLRNERRTLVQGALILTQLVAALDLFKCFAIAAAEGAGNQAAAGTQQHQETRGNKSPDGFSEKVLHRKSHSSLPPVNT